MRTAGRPPSNRERSGNVLASDSLLRSRGHLTRAADLAPSRGIRSRARGGVLTRLRVILAGGARAENTDGTRCDLLDIVS
jgi:hypothetical protein